MGEDYGAAGADAGAAATTATPTATPTGGTTAVAADGVVIRRTFSFTAFLLRAVTTLWWTFLVALGTSLAQSLGTHLGPPLLAFLPRALAWLRQQPPAIQVGAGLAAAVVLVGAGWLTYLSWKMRVIRQVKELRQRVEDVKDAISEVNREQMLPPIHEIQRSAGDTEKLVEEVVAPGVEALLDESQQRAERQRRDAALERVGDLKLTSFKMGGEGEADYPYILVDRLEPVYAAAVNALQAASAPPPATTRGLLVVGESNAGKTRLALEVLRATLPDWRFQTWNPAARLEHIPLRSELDGQQVVLFVDDVQDYARGSGRSSGAVNALPEQFQLQALSGEAAGTLRELVRRVTRDAARVLIVLTCRSEELTRTEADLGWLMDQLTRVTVPTFPREETDPEAARIINAFEERGEAHAEEWDGTLGSLVLRLRAKHQQYLQLARAHDPAVTILHAMKLLHGAGVREHTTRRVRAVCGDERLFDQRALLEDNATWRDARDTLLRLQFVREQSRENDEAAAEDPILEIRKDPSYYEQVITEYPSPLHPEELERHRLRLPSVFSSLQDADALLDLGYGFAAAKRYSDAEAAFRHVLELRPDDAATWLLLGAALGLQQRYAEAEVAFHHALELRPDDAATWHSLGAVLANQQRYAEAEAAFRHVLDLRPEDAAETWYALGLVLGEQQRYAEAEAAYRRALELRPDDADTWDSLGLALGEQQRYADAEAAFRRALELRPDDAATWYNLGVALANQQRYSEAEAAYRRALELRPDDADTLYNLGVALRRQQRYPEAEAAYRHALELRPDDADTWNGLAYTCLYQQRYDDALSAIAEALAREPEQGSWWDSRGEILLAMARYDEAAEALRQAHARGYTDDPESYDRLAQALHALGRDSEAEAAEVRAQQLRGGAQS